MADHVTSELHEVGGLAFASYIDVIGEEADRLAHACGRGLEAAVPTCPGWTIADLIAHVTDVYRFFTAQLEAADPDERVPHDGGHAGNPLDAFDDGVARLVSTLERLGPDSPSWNWSGTDLVAGWVARRMALETAVHRFDGENTFGRAMQIESELAVDGLDKRLDVHLRVDILDQPKATLGGSVCMVCSDVDAAWVIEVGAGRVRWRRARGPADVVLVGTASDLFLFSWNRVGLDALSVTGRRDVASAWRDLPV